MKFLLINYSHIKSNTLNVTSNTKYFYMEEDIEPCVEVSIVPLSWWYADFGNTFI